MCPFLQINAGNGRWSIWRHSSDRNARSDAAANGDTQAASHTRAYDHKCALGKNQSLITDRSNVSSFGQKILLAFFASACAISWALNRRASAAIRHKEIPNAGA